MRTHDTSLKGTAGDLTGNKYGTYTCIGVKGKSEKGYGNYWLLRCECGEDRIILASNLLYHARVGKFPECAACSKYSAISLQRLRRQQLFIHTYIKCGTLYTKGMLRQMENDIKDGLSTILGPTYIPKPKYEVLGPYLPDKSKLGYMPLVPLQAPDDHVYKCADCNKKFRLGSGCLTCIEPVCAKCSDKGLHNCCPSESLLQEIGDIYGLTRERIRQIEVIAKNKMRTRLQADGIYGHD